jgi:hypothetical protein
MKCAERESSVNNNKSDWDKFRGNQNKFIFYPHEEVIRFVSRFIGKRVGLKEFDDVEQGDAKGGVIDSAPFEIVRAACVELACHAG